MTKILKKHLALLLAVVLCLSLAACGESEGIVEGPVGDDWRVTGVVVDSGTITHEGEGSVRVLVTVDESWAAFYRDEPEQILFDSVSFPVTIPDAQEAFDGISFDDIDGDGESDVSVSFVYGPGDSISLIWIWDPEERYVFQEDLSVLSSGGISDYVGLWEYVNEDTWIRIYEDETWECFDAQGNVFQSGTAVVDSTGITFYSDDFEETLHFDRTASGDLIDSESDSMLVPAYDVQFEDDLNTGSGGDLPGLSEGDYSVFQGVWLCDTNDQFDFMDVNADGDWDLYSNGDVIDNGYFWYDPAECVTYVYSSNDEGVDDGRIDLDGEQLDISTLGSFHYLGRSASEFQGVWYLDYDLSAERYITIDSDGEWSYYQRTPGDAEATELDWGTFTFDMDVADGIYYANSMYDDVTSYLVLDFDDGILVWGDEGAYYRMED